MTVADSEELEVLSASERTVTLTLGGPRISCEEELEEEEPVQTPGGLLFPPEEEEEEVLQLNDPTPT